MHILDAKKNVIHYCLNMNHVQPDVILDYPSHVALDIVENDVEFSEAVRVLRRNNVNQLYDAGMIKPH